MELLERARKSLNKSIGDTEAISAQSHALDSIAASLLYIAENMNQKPATVSDDKIELIVRRLLEDAKAPTVKAAKVKK